LDPRNQDRSQRPEASVIGLTVTVKRSVNS
jgi:hypothetical protein